MAEKTTLVLDLEVKLSARVWTPDKIAAWALKTFGPRHPMVIAARLNKEMSELLTAIAVGEASADDICEECADVAIVLAQIPAAYGANLDEFVDRKMPVNVSRTWVRDKHGDLQHA